MLAVKDCRVNLYQERVSISPGFNSVFVVNVENIPEARSLYEWYQSADLNEVQTLTGGGGDKQFNSLYRTVRQMEQDSQYLAGDKKLYSDLYIYLGGMRKEPPPYYLGCPTCSKKLIEDGDKFMCNSCAESHDTPKCKFIFSAQFTDQSGKVWLNVNNSVGEQLLATTADRLYETRHDPDSLSQLIDQVKYTRIKVRVVSYLDVYNQESRLKHSIIRMMSPDPV